MGRSVFSRTVTIVQVVDAAERTVAEFQDDRRLVIANPDSGRLVDHDCACTPDRAISETQQVHEMTNFAYCRISSVGDHPVSLVEDHLIS
jgi:hypothetical protein